MKTKILLFGAFVMLSFFVSCNSDEKTTQGTTAISSQDIAINAKIDASIDDIADIGANQFLVQRSLSNKTSAGFNNMLPSCATFTTVLVDGVWTSTIDFGTEGCTFHNGNVMKGKIIVSFANDFTSMTHTLTFRFEGFQHNGKLLQGNKIIIFAQKSTDLLTAVHPVLTITDDISITFSDNTIYTRTGTKIREVVEGLDTPLNWQDDVILVTGNSATKKPNGDTIATTITTPLRLEMSCQLPFPVSGVISITKNSSTATLDYGTGECDDLATKTIDGVATVIHLEK